MPTISFVEVILGLARENNIDLYVTGSNSKMLSSDIVTEFRDKATNISIRPLSFEEFYLFKGGSKNDAVYEYMMYGGMPLAVLKDEDELLYNGYTVNIGVFDTVEKDTNGKSIKKNYEIDFLAKKGIRQFYIQISSDISNLETKKRDVKPFIVLNDQIKKVIVINKPINETLDENGFTVIGVADFLLRFIK